jgi:anti-sigma B factor antagonist
MDIRTRHYNDVAILSINGRMDSVNAPQLLQTIEEQVTIDYARLVIDLKKVDFLNSIGIKSLLQGTELTRQRGGDIRLANVHTHLRSVLKLARVDSVIKIYPNVIRATVSYLPSSLPGKTKYYSNF